MRFPKAITTFSIITIITLLSIPSFAANKQKKAKKVEEVTEENVNPATQDDTAPNYAKKEVINAISSGDLNNVPFNEMWVKQYLLIVAQNISSECKGNPISLAEFNNLNTTFKMQQKGFTENNMSNNGLAYLYRGLQDLANKNATLKNGGLSVLEKESNEKAQILIKISEEAIQDSAILLESKKCNSKSLNTFSRNLINFVSDIGAERVPTEELSRRFSPYANPNHTSQGARFSFCLALKFNHPDMIITRPQRLGLYQVINTGDNEKFVTAFREIRNANYHNEPSFEDCFKGAY